MLEITTTNPRASVFHNMINLKFFICLILSACAALGTIPYGYQFAETLPTQSEIFAAVFGILFAGTAALANMMLGTYSLLSIKNKKSERINSMTLLVSTLGSIPYGFLCYFGYESTLPLSVNLLISVIVVIVNAGIGYTAISNLALNVQTYLQHKAAKKPIPFAAAVLRLAGFLLGVAISLVTYLAASDGISDLLLHYQQTTLVKQYSAGFLAAIISWLPCAALFANANQVVMGDLYKESLQWRTLLKKMTVGNIFLLLFCLASGTAIAQMTASFFSADKNIPQLFKNANVLFFAQHYLVPLALLSSAALNYFSIKNLIQNLRAKN